MDFAGILKTIPTCQFIIMRYYRGSDNNVYDVIAISIEETKIA